MSLHLEDRWIWDFWLARRGPEHHVFFLHAPRALGDPDQRHWNVAIGHAVSEDLSTWARLPDAMRPGQQGEWDDYTTWTGSVIEVPGGWALLYTGTSRAENGLVQRIGLARSDDLVHWTRHPGNPVLEADARWYELLDLGLWHDQAWRDPCVLRDPGTGDYHAFVTARANHGPAGGRGVIAHATSSDLEEWEVRPPLGAPKGFGQMEIPQVLRLGGRWHLLFSAHAWAQAERRDARPTGTFHAVSDRLTGPYEESSPLLTDERERYYGAKVVVDGAGLRCLAFVNLDERGQFVGDLSDPWPVILGPGGELRIADRIAGGNGGA